MKTQESPEAASIYQTFAFYVMLLLIIGIVVGFASTYFAGASAGPFNPNTINSGDTAWVLAASALVLLMTPAVGFFYGGLVTSKNVVSVIKQTLLIMGLVSIQWVLVGYSLAFGQDFQGIIGGLNFFGLSGVGFAPSSYAKTIPQSAFMIFQAMGAIITPALIIGSIVERVRFRTLVIFVLLWTTLVYDPVAHWIWGSGGWLQKLGVLDFAGGAVVHTNAGFAGLAAALVIGKRRDFKQGEAIASHHVPFVLLGAGLLWFGWVGFNGGSALGASPVAVNAFIVTNTAGAAGALVWMLLSWAEKKKPSAMSTAIGAVCGLIAITPASGFVGPMASLAIGIISSLVSYLALYLRSQRTQIDDTLDVWAAHGISGVTGVLLTGVFAEKAINNAGNNGLLFGNPTQFGIQLLAVFVTLAYSFGMTFLLLKVLAPLGLRVSAQEEAEGLDVAVHGEEAYGLTKSLGEAEARITQLEARTDELHHLADLALRPASNASRNQQKPKYASASVAPDKSLNTRTISEQPTYMHEQPEPVYASTSLGKFTKTRLTSDQPAYTRKQQEPVSASAAPKNQLDMSLLYDQFAYPQDPSESLYTAAPTATGNRADMSLLYEQPAYLRNQPERVYTSAPVGSGNPAKTNGRSNQPVYVPKRPEPVEASASSASKKLRATNTLYGFSEDPYTSTSSGSLQILPCGHRGLANARFCNICGAVVS
jgi:ammonium transporter, Amt family